MGVTFPDLKLKHTNASMNNIQMKITTLEFL